MVCMVCVVLIFCFKTWFICCFTLIKLLHKTLLKKLKLADLTIKPNSID